MHSVGQDMHFSLSPRRELTIHPDVSIAIIKRLICHRVFLSCKV